MKKCKLLFSDLLFLLRHDTGCVIVVFLSLFLSFSAALLIISMVGSNWRQLMSLEKEKQIYNINPSFCEFSSYPESFRKCFLEEGAPEIEGFESFSPLFAEKYTGNYQVKEVAVWKACFTQQDCMKLNLTQAFPRLSEGRWFTEEELEEGSCTAVLSKVSYPNCRLGDRILVAGQEFTVIGIAESDFSAEEDFIKTTGGGCLPFQAMCRIPFQNDRSLSCISDINVIFTAPLTQSQFNYYLKFLYVPPQSRYDTQSQGALYSLIRTLILSLGVMAAVILNLMGLYWILIKRSIYRFQLLKLCGARNRFLLVYTYFPSLTITAVGILFSILFYTLLLYPTVSRYFSCSDLSIGEMAVSEGAFCFCAGFLFWFRCVGL